VSSLDPLGSNLPGRSNDGELGRFFAREDPFGQVLGGLTDQRSIIAPSLSDTLLDYRLTMGRLGGRGTGIAPVCSMSCGPLDMQVST
jgi:hypothetical protein